MLMLNLSEYINANAPMTNLPELLNLHHSNPLGFHPLVLPLFLLVLAIGMHFVIHFIYFKDRNTLFPLLYTLLTLAVATTYYYAFCGDLPLFEDWQLEEKEICIGWFCQRSIVGVGWSILGVVLLTYTVYFLIGALKLVISHMCDKAGMDEELWREWRHVIIFMLIGASAAGVADDFAPIAGIWIMIVYLIVSLIMIVVKMIADTVRTHNFWHSLLIAVCFLVGFVATTIWVIECIEGYIYVFVPLVCLFATVSVHYKKKIKS